MSKAATKRRPPERRVQYPKSNRPDKPGLSRSWLIGLAAAAAVVVAAVGFLATQRSGEEAVAAGLPNTPDYHSLLVAAADPRTVVLGTHEGLFRSTDGGRTWEKTALGGQDAMNLARAQRGVVWTAGHNVLAKSIDGGRTWQDVRPKGLPHLDVHGFAVDPRDPTHLWAALAGQGLYRSTDGGKTFELVSREVGPAVMALAVTPAGRILAGDMQRGLMASSDEGKSWKLTLRAGLMGLAVNPAEPSSILATGPGVLLSEDGGRNWRQVRAIEQGAGPVAWSKSDPKLAYVVGFDRVLYRTLDGGRSWHPVGEET